MQLKLNYITEFFTSLLTLKVSILFRLISTLTLFLSKKYQAKP